MGINRICIIGTGVGTFFKNARRMCRMAARKEAIIFRAFCKTPLLVRPKV